MCLASQHLLPPPSPLLPSPLPLLPPPPRLLLLLLLLPPPPLLLLLPPPMVPLPPVAAIDSAALAFDRVCIMVPLHHRSQRPCLTGWIVSRNVERQSAA